MQIQATRKDAMDLFLRGSIALAEMEHHGIKINEGYLDQAIKDISSKIAELTSKIKAHPIADFWKKQHQDKTNYGSRSQLGEVLFSEVPTVETKLFGKKEGRAAFANYPWGNEGRTKSGRYRTDDDTLKKVDLPFVKDWLEIEQLKKIKSTYFEGLKREVVDGYVYPFFHLTSGGTDEEKGGAKSYRSSSSHPNIQNQLVRVEDWGKKVRCCYIPRKGNVFIEVDYSSLEFRIASCIWSDPEIVKYASDPTLDIHRDIAAKMFLCKKKQVSKGLRYLGKNGYVFPHLYGSWWKKIASNVWRDCQGLKLADGTDLMEHLASKGITELGNCNTKLRQEPREGTFEKVVKEVEKDFDKQFCVFRKNADAFFEEYQKNGYFDLVTGFRCHGLYSKNQVLNTPVQGPAFHCLLWSLATLSKRLQEKNLKCLIVAEVHDSMLLDCPINEVSVVLPIIHGIMTQEIRQHWSWLVVPLEVEIQVAEKSWADKKTWTSQNGAWSPKDGKP